MRKNKQKITFCDAIKAKPLILCYNFLIFETWEGRPLFAKTYGATTLGIDGRIIDVEVDVSQRIGIAIQW